MPACAPFPDAADALIRRAERNGPCPSLLESYVGGMDSEGWSDFVFVYAKDGKHVGSARCGDAERIAALARVSGATERGS